MATELAPDPTIRPPHPIWGTVLRIGFYLVIGVFSLEIWTILLLWVVGNVAVAAAGGVFAAAFTTNALTMRMFDRRPIADIGLGTAPGTGRNFAVGIAIGASAAAIMLGMPLALSEGHLISHPGAGFAWGKLVFYLLILFFGAVGEEVLFRGYAFQLLIQKIGPFATVLPVGVLFGLAHADNHGSTLLSICNTSLWGIILGVAFLRTHDLWLPIGLHFGWNAVLPVFGVNLSGLTIDVTRYVYRWDVSALWSGGSYGPEGGLLTTIFGIFTLVAVCLVPVARQKAAIAQVLNDSSD